ncbi:hypothetical protein F511_14947 [Dorcoceras hygrometricum]|uniref:Stress up-regulated Nod 19 protein n=1 Tax=Dorcoceras hygrometricum TaxID=472368 RepID=A0A2Z7AHW9_9LAMI|nr:hypothetical protein F511_14947 [Dorcoceras hygrometricum]
MVRGSGCWFLCLAIPLIIVIVEANQRTENGLKTEVFSSPEFALEPGSVSNKYYYNVDFPRGHIAIKSFNGEVVDENGRSIPLHETYLHHWVVLRYYQRKGVDIHVPTVHGDLGFLQSKHIIVKNSGVCDNGLTQYFGLGSETRRTVTDVPDPYGIEVGNPDDIPDGYEERWMVNVHAIDTRGTDDKLGCTECRCDLYNVTNDEYGHVVPRTYFGGLRCCYNGARCRVRDGFQGEKRSLHLRYTVKYLEWDPSILPVRIYIFDVTDIWTKAEESRGVRARHQCLVEYDVESCPVAEANEGCSHSKSLAFSFPTGGEVIYGVGHQHAGGTGTTLYGEGGRVICSSNPTYGNGVEPGNEEGYIVGMSTCYPSPGSVKISAGETLTLVSNYSSSQKHTGVMGLFYILLADSSAKSNAVLHAPADVRRERRPILEFSWAVALLGVALVVVVMSVVFRRSGREESYEAILA